MATAQDPAVIAAKAMEAKAWPFEEARKICARLGSHRARTASATNKPVLFQTGYGPSGLPHIGTFAEVLRTSMVRRAFHILSQGHPSRLLCFSDDMDGLRKVPENIPNPTQLEKHLGKPLTRVPDPFGCHDSFGEHNNAQLERFLNRFEFQYELKSATQCYHSGEFDRALRLVLEHYEEVVSLIRASLGKERRETYSPFLPICPERSVVLQAPVLETDAEKGQILYRHPDGTIRETSVFGGKCKLQWKPDWAMRWYALEVDYEMYGKDLIPSAELSRKILRLLGGQAPEGFVYELFLDEKGEKISKSRGNGLALDQWLSYGSEDSLAYFMYRKPRTAKRLFFDCIPSCMDAYLIDARRLQESSTEVQFENPVFHIEQRILHPLPEGLSFSLLQNLVSAIGGEPSMLRSYVARFQPDLTPEHWATIERMLGYACAYDKDFVRPYRSLRKATEQERTALELLRDKLRILPPSAEVETIQTAVYQAGTEGGYHSKLRDWFQALYEVLLGQSTGPRFGSFLKLYGLDKGILLIESALQNTQNKG